MQPRISLPHDDQLHLSKFSFGIVASGNSKCSGRRIATALYSPWFAKRGRIVSLRSDRNSAGEMFWEVEAPVAALAWV
jgi:hypothetical protein